VVSTNNGEYLERALESLVVQDLTDTSIAFIDNYSRDNTKDIFSHYYQKFLEQGVGISWLSCPVQLPLIKVINLALQICNSKYIVRLDGDDQLKPSALKFLLKPFSEEANIVASYGNYDEILSDDTFVRSVDLATCAPGVFADFFIHGACTLFATSALKSLAPLDERFEKQDGLQIFLKIKRIGLIYHVTEKIFDYRMHDQQLTSKLISLNNVKGEIFKSFVDINKFYRKINLVLLFGVAERYFFWGKKSASNWEMLIKGLEEISFAFDLTVVCSRGQEERITELTSAVGLDGKFVVEDILKDVPLRSRLKNSLGHQGPDSESLYLLLTDDYPLRRAHYIDIVACSVALNDDAVETCRTVRSVAIELEDGNRNLVGSSRAKHSREPIYLKSGGVTGVPGRLIDAFLSDLSYHPLFVEVDELSGLRFDSELISYLAGD
jgi:glycosyltransferase involved in cell wall biosynthesis